jgi:hypothetical protein
MRSSYTDRIRGLLLSNIVILSLLRISEEKEVDIVITKQLLSYNITILFRLELAIILFT